MAPRNLSLLLLLAPAALWGSQNSLAATTDHFESAAVHPVEISPDGTRLFVAHTADHRLVVFDLAQPVPVRIAEIQVGIEPVTVRARTNTEVWVVNHVSDSISIIDLATMNVVRTLLPGDEPTDVVFVPAQNRAFVCVSQEDKIRVYNTSDWSQAPLDIALPGSDPRSLALAPGNATLYVAMLDSQNQTTTVPFQSVIQGGGLPAPNPPMDPTLPGAPDVGLIVRHDGTKWTDEIGRNWNPFVPYQLPDVDVVKIDTATRQISGSFQGVGTTLFNIGVNPVTGRLYISNQEASNEIRFEPNVQGKFLKNRMTTIDPGSGAIAHQHLNAHINYSNPSGTGAERALSLAIPLDVDVSSDGQAVFVAAFGSRKIGVLNSAGVVTRRISAGEGPAGLAVDDARQRLYVYNRFSSSLSVVNLSTDTSVELSLGFDPSPTFVREGRKFLYDGEITSAHGDLACASCHVFGTMDNIAWDLGNPLGDFIPPNFIGLQGFHPMKGPMTTQSLKGLSGTEPLHWRGDRPQLADFNPAFVSLMGAPASLTPTQFDLFEDFVFSMRYPPNPLRLVSGALPATLNGANPIHGEQLFLTGQLVGALNCVSCHALPTGENGLIIPASAILEDQDMKVPQLRNMFEKTRFDNTQAATVRGFGYTHDGAVDDLFTFLHFPGFDFANDGDRHDVEAFLLAFDSGTHAAVGAQWTMDGTNEGAGSSRLTTLTGLASSNAIGLVAKGRDLSGQARGWEFSGGNAWAPDRAQEPPANTAALLALAGSGTEITFTAVLEGTEHRLGVDHDGDGFFDRDELDAGSDPGNPLSVPGGPTGAPVIASGTIPDAIWQRGANPASVESRLGFALGVDGPANLRVFDLQGRRVATLFESGHHPSGRFESIWDLRDEQGRRVAAGTYFVRLETSRGSTNDRVVILR